MRARGIPDTSVFLRRGELKDKITLEPIKLAYDIIDCLTKKQFRWEIRTPIESGELKKTVKAPKMYSNGERVWVLSPKAYEDLTSNMSNNSIAESRFKNAKKNIIQKLHRVSNWAEKWFWR